MERLTHTPERWLEIQRRFDEIVDLEPETRTTRLIEIALEDADLEREIRLLLNAYEETGRVLGRLDALEPAFLPPLADIRPGTSVGPYEVLEEIGRGGMGVIYKARDGRLDRLVALKFLPAHAHTDPGSNARFMTEAKAASALDHPNICTVHETGETDDGRLFIAMAYYEGRTLDARIGEGPLPLDECLFIARKIAAGLVRAHQAGILHRDIKPSNVMITDHNEVKILDFGLAKLLDASVQTRTGRLLGTAAYMSPEQTGSEAINHQTDLWSLGVLLYEMVTGRRPFRAANEQAIIFAIRNDEPERASSLRADLPESFERVIHRLLEKTPDARYRDASELIADLDALAENHAWRLPWGRRTVRRLAKKRSVVLPGISAMILVVVWTATSAFPQFQWSSVFAPSSGSMQIRQVWAVPEHSGMAASGSPSPDGRSITYTDSQTGDLFVREFGTGESRQLTHHQPSNNGEYAHNSVVSPDGRLVAYSWAQAEGWYELRLIGMDGSGERVLFGGGMQLPLVEVHDWSTDGGHVLAAVYPDENTLQAVLVSVEDGSARVVEELTGVFSSVRMALSPDGRFVTFDRTQPGSSVDHDIYTVNVETGQDAAVVSHASQDYLLGWQRSGEAILFASDRTGMLGIWRQVVAEGRAAGEPELVRPDVGRITPVGFTRDGSFFYNLSVGGPDVHIAALDAERGTITDKPAPINPRFSGLNSEADWSPDGTRMAYVSRRGFLPANTAPPALVIRSVETGEERVFYPELENFSIPQWSPDGRTILVQGRNPESRGLFLIDSENGSTRFLASGNGGMARWAPDGSSVYIGAADQQNPGSRRLVKLDVETGHVETLLRLESPPNFAPRFSLSPDGSAVVFPVSGGDGGESGLLLVHLADGTRRDLIQPDLVDGDMIWSPQWSPDGRMIYFLRTRYGPDAQWLDQIWRVPAEGGTAEYAGFEQQGIQRWIRIHPNGRQIAFTAGTSGSEIWVMENFVN